jgi:NAD(P)-dependent dehydrogenase (short-subunit alcohol dehydrogenase family)
LAHRRITTPFDASSPAAEVARGADLFGTRAIVTGADTVTARVLAGAGAAVTLAVCDVDAGLRAAADIAAGTGNDHVRAVPLDLSDLGSIADFVAEWDLPLHLLVNGARVSDPPERHTADGWETHFAVNHLGHFALALGLHDALASAGTARIVAVSSPAHLLSPVVFEDVHFAFRPYDPVLAHAQSMTATALFAVGATARWARDGITANAATPGATTTLLATSPLLDGVGGRYFEDCQEAVPARARRGVALDTDCADRLWELSLRLVGRHHNRRETPT